MKRFVYFLILVFAISAAAGCKLRIKSTNNGEVVSKSGENHCAKGQVCNIDVVDLFFDDTFTAKPSEGFVFGGWKGANKHFCGGKHTPCRLFTSGFEGNDTLEGFLATNDVFFLSPDFIDPLETLLGSWSGEWNNTTFGSSGAFSFEFIQLNNQRLRLKYDVDGNVFGQADPPAGSIDFELDGSKNYSLDTTFNGNQLTLTLELKDNGTVKLAIPDLPVNGLDAYEATGTLSRNKIKMDYKVLFTTGAPAVGTIVVNKES